MAIITTPGAGVSPYETTTTTPTVLRAGADGSTTLAAVADTATGSNTSVYVSGQAALNSLITSSQPGVFEGANVTINLEEQLFNTTNQVTATTNYPSGDTGEIQYNSGSNSFASSAYFTYTSGNVIAPGIRTDGYFYSNGAPFTGGGNAAIGNFVFTGDNMTVAHANSTLSVTGNGIGNINVSANSKTWIFGASGNLTLPGNTFAVNYANNQPVVIGSSGLPLSNGTSNINIATANGNVTITANGSPTWTFGTNNILTLPGGPRIVPVGANLELQAASDGYAEIVTSDGNNYVAVTTSGAQIVTSGINTWTFDNVGNLILPGNTFAVKYANGDTVAISSGGFPLANGTSNIDIATANGNVTVGVSGNTWTFDNTSALIFPSGAEITSDNTGAAVFQHEGGVTIAETNGNAFTYNSVLELYDNAIHIGTDQQGNAYSWDFSQDGSMTVPGNISGANVITANVFTALSNVSITSSGNTWTFDTAGVLTVPGEGIINSIDDTVTLRSSNTSSGNANSVYLGTSGGLGFSDQSIGANWLEIFRSGIDPQLGTTGNLLITTDSSNTATTWTFDNQGNLTLPGSLIVPANSIITGVGASPAPSINGFNNIDAIAFSASGNITGAYFFGNGSQLTDVGVASVPGQNILPTIQTITVAATSGVGNAGGAGDAFANVTVANTIPVTEYGVIVTAGTSSQKYATGALGSIPGTVQLTFSTGLNSTPFTVYAYVTSNAGTYYSNSATGTSGICLLAGTQIALSDGSRKAIEDITYTDKLLSWDFDRGCYAETTALWIKRSETGSQYNLLTFSDGTTLRTFDQHRIFNKQAGAFTYPMTDATPIGTITVNEHGQEITLINKQMIQDTIEYYNVITDYHMNLFSDSVLTSCRFNNIYPITDMKFVKDSRTLRTRAEFENVEDRFFHGLRLAEQTADIETVEWYVNRLLATEVSTQSELAF